MAKPATEPCPSCGTAVSRRAFDCPSCGHPIRKARRGPFGILVKWLFIAFNILMLILLFGYLVSSGEVMNDLTTEAEQAGAAIGATLGTGMLLVIWVLGDVILGLATLLSRPRR